MGTRKVEVLIQQCTHDSRLDRLLFGCWWWKVTTFDPFASKSGFARSQETANKKAGKAAWGLSPVAEPKHQYVLEVGE